MMRVPLSISLLCAWLMSSADCSHIRGGSMSWKPTTNASQIEISHQMAWRRSSSSSSFCNDATIATQGTLTVSAYLYCRVGCNSSSRISLMHGKCIAYSASEDWSLGEDSFIFNVPIPGIKYTFRLEDCCWQSIRNRGSSDSMRMTMTADLRPRADTGVMNSSPVATMSPIVRLLAGCQHSFRIPETGWSAKDKSVQGLTNPPYPGF
uniref:CBM20 domain-containing protein n=1 Tax=Magallana gigas TaxID=29159 RepID=A0A8W8MPF9_MAGGI